jgi:hypothetical protein
VRGTEEYQFAGYDSLETRKLIYRLLDELGHGRCEMDAAEIRADWLRALLRYSENGFAQQMVQITPCSAPEAFRVFTAITSALGVPIARAVELLEQTIREYR